VSVWLCELSCGCERGPWLCHGVYVDRIAGLCVACGTQWWCFMKLRVSYGSESAPPSTLHVIGGACNVHGVCDGVCDGVCGACGSHPVRVSQEQSLFHSLRLGTTGCRPGPCHLIKLHPTLFCKQPLLEVANIPTPCELETCCVNCVCEGIRTFPSAKGGTQPNPTPK
jgi:hypothetical protein